MLARVLAGILVAVTAVLLAASARADVLSEEILSGGAPRGRSPYFFGGSSPIPKTQMAWPGNEAPGTIIINTSERRLYLVLGGGQALRYGIGVLPTLQRHSRDRPLAASSSR